MSTYLVSGLLLWVLYLFVTIAITVKTKGGDLSDAPPKPPAYVALGMLLLICTWPLSLALALIGDYRRGSPL